MCNQNHLKHSGFLDMRGLNRRATVRYRRIPANHGRVFVANSSKSVDAWVLDLSEGGIGLIVGTYIEAGTPVRIEMGDTGKVPYVDLVATITHTSQLENGKWRCGCEWIRKLTPEELQVPRCNVYHTPHGTRYVKHYHSGCGPVSMVASLGHAEEAMKRLLAAACVLSVLLMGCSQQPQIPAIHKHDLFGGRYSVEIETVGSFIIASSIESREVGGEKVAELAELKWGNNKLKIDKGKLSFNDKDCGTLQPGDSVRVDKDGQMYVNGKQRP
jgi:hypothetical protein